MAKRSTGWTEQKIAKYEKEGRGQGEFGNYKPWLTIQDVPSEGRSHRPIGWKTNRIHHLLSDMERNLFYCLEWANDVLDIREQFPIMNREETVQISEELGISHPKDKETGTPIVLTTDLFITVKRENGIRYVAKSVKPSDKLEDKRTVEKLDIEREYWTRKGVSWALITEKDLMPNFVRNMATLHPYYYPKTHEHVVLGDELCFWLSESKETLVTQLSRFDEEHGLDAGSALSLFKYLLARKIIRFDIKGTVFSTRMATDLFTYPTELESRRRKVQ